MFRALSSSYRTISSILVVDTPGFQNASSCGRSAGSSFEDFCHNYTQERLQLLFHDTVFTSQQDLYAQVDRSRVYGQFPLSFMERKSRCVPILEGFQTSF